MHRNYVEERINDIQVDVKRPGRWNQRRICSCMILELVYIRPFLTFLLHFSLSETMYPTNFWILWTTSNDPCLWSPGKRL